MDLKPYTDRQLDIINGVIDIKEVRPSEVGRLLKKAMAFKDEKAIKIAQEQYNINSKSAKERTNERNKQAYHEKKKTGFAWKSPKSTEYTDRQKQIINDEISLNSVQTRELIIIAKKAEAVGDSGLYETMISLIHDRKAESAERNRQRTLEAQKQKKLENKINFSTKGVLNKYEIGILEGIVDFDEYSLDHLYHIRDVCQKRKDTQYLEIVEDLIRYKEYPDNSLIKASHQETIDMISEMLAFPIETKPPQK